MIFVSFLSGIAIFFTFSTFPVLTTLLSFSVAVLSLIKRRYVFVIFLVISLIYAYFRYAPPPDVSAFSAKIVEIECAVKEPPFELSSGKYGNKAMVLNALDIEKDEPIIGLKNREVIIVSDTGLANHMRYRIIAKGGRDNERLNPGVVGTDRYYFYLEDINETEESSSKGVILWFREKRESLNRHLKDNFTKDTASLLTAVTTGGQSLMSEEIKEAFTTTGLAHLLSISGTHFGLFSMLIFGMTRLAITSIPYRALQKITVWLTPSQAAAIISLPFMIMYLLISGASVPAVRSFIMINIFLLGLLIGRKGFWLNSLMFAAFIICIGEPSAMLSLSFQLSFLAVLFIGISLGDREKIPQEQTIPQPEEKEKTLPDRLIKPLKDSVILTISVSLGTAPIVAYYFHYFSIISPLSNLIITPLIGFILLPLSLISAFAFIFTGCYPFKPIIGLVAEASLRLIKFSGAIPFADIKIPPFPLIVIPVFYAGVILYLVRSSDEMKTRIRYIIISSAAGASMFIASLLLSDAGLAVTYLDVGQGDSAVIEASGKTIVIDTGRTGREVKSHIRYLGKRSIDALIITHSDSDHCGGTSLLAESNMVREIWDNGLLTYPEGLSAISKRHFERGDVITWDRFALNILHPYKGFYTFSDSYPSEENNNSLTARVTGKWSSFLFTADAAEEAEEDMLHLGRLLKSDVFKIPHHGSRTSTTEGFLASVSPDIAVISVGRQNPFGHPHHEILERLQGIRVYRTDRDGAVKITETSHGLKVKTFKGFMFEKADGISGEWRNIKRLFMKW